MKPVIRRRPSASMIVSLTALVLAASGTAVAASGLVKGDSLIKKHSLSGNRLRYKTITGAQIKLSKLGTVPSANDANFATNATNATNATSAATAGNLSGLTRFKMTISPAGSSFATANVVTLATDGPLSLLGKCFSSAGAVTGDFFLRTTTPAQVNAYYYNFGNGSGHGGALNPGTDAEAGFNRAVATPPAIAWENPNDGTFAAITDNASNYMTGLASVGINLNSSGGCTFAGFTMAS